MFLISFDQLREPDPSILQFDEQIFLAWLVAAASVRMVSEHLHGEKVGVVEKQFSATT